MHKEAGESRLIGTYGYLAIFFWSLGLVLFSSGQRMVLSALVCFVVAGIVYPQALRSLFRLRWLLLLLLLIAVDGLWVGEVDQNLFGVPLSTAGLAEGFYMALRALVILVSVDGLSRSVSITEVSGLLERVGLPGLGFSLGVAFNLLPGLRQSGANVWRSLWMRGGLRRQRWRALQLFWVTTLANALHRAEEIALAAEARAYSPLRTRPLPLKRGRMDRLIVLLALLSGPLILWIG